jgi:hypothetical protein
MIHPFSLFFAPQIYTYFPYTQKVKNVHYIEKNALLSPKNAVFHFSKITPPKNLESFARFLNP